MAARSDLVGVLALTLVGSAWIACAAGEASDDDDDTTTTSTTWNTGGDGGTGATSSGGGGSSGGSGGSSAGGSGGGGGDTTPPTVTTTTPADNTDAIAPDTKVTITFSESMNAGTVTANTNTTCSGSVMLSADNFSSCVAMTGSPTTSDNTTFELTPAAALDSTLTYVLRANTTVQDVAGNALASQYQAPNGFQVRYFHTIAIDGSNDFASAEELLCSTTGCKLFLAHDATHVYFAVEHQDVVVGGSGNKFIYFLLSTDTNLATGNTTSSDGKAKFGFAGTKQMSHHFKIQIDGGNYAEHRIGNGSDWSTDWGSTGKDYAKAAGYLEGSVALSELGNPSTIIATTYTIDYPGGSGNGWLYNMAGGATDGSGLTPLDLYAYIQLTLPTSLEPNNLSQSGLY